MGKAQPKNWIVGRWLTESMDQWDRDFIDEEVRGYFEFDAKDSGDFQFGYVQGLIDYRLGERDGKPAVEFSWVGYDAGGGDDCLGRGWMVLDGTQLTGRLYIHLADDSGIVLKREPEDRVRRRFRAKPVCKRHRRLQRLAARMPRKPSR